MKQLKHKNLFIVIYVFYKTLTCNDLHNFGKKKINFKRELIAQINFSQIAQITQIIFHELLK